MDREARPAELLQVRAPDQVRDAVTLGLDSSPTQGSSPVRSRHDYTLIWPLSLE